jgi:hypothetical protein
MNAHGCPTALQPARDGELRAREFHESALLPRHWAPRQSFAQALAKKCSCELRMTSTLDRNSPSAAMSNYRSGKCGERQPTQSQLADAANCAPTALQPRGLIIEEVNQPVHLQHKVGRQSDSGERSEQ